MLGYEANYAGTSFATLDKRESRLPVRQRASSTSSPTRPRPAASAPSATTTRACKTKRWDLIKDGKLVDYQATATRPTSSARPNRTAAATPTAGPACSSSAWPTSRCSPARTQLSVDDMIKDVENGIYIVGDGSFSIDQQRYNAQFGGQLFYEIKNGKIAGMLEDVAYQIRTPEFWNACVGDLRRKRLPPGRLVLRRQGPAEPGRRRSRTAPAPRASTASTSSTPRARSADRPRRHNNMSILTEERGQGHPRQGRSRCPRPTNAPPS